MCRKQDLTLAIAIVWLALGSLAAQRTQAPTELVVCGWDEVFILRFPDATDSKPERTWTWRAKGRSDLPQEFHGLFNSTDDCKPFEDGTLLITSSGGAAALVDRHNDRVLFYGRAANAHSADRLPGGRIAVAASHDRAGKGDRLILFDANKSNEELWSGELPWGHGVIWDARRRLLWALADEDIRVYEPREWNSPSPKLERVAVIPLPEGGGHDFTAVDATLIALSTSNRTWLFDRDARTFRPHPHLASTAKVKSIHHHPRTRQIVYVQAEGENWWAERIHFLDPAGTLHIPGEHFYKARWHVPARIP